MCTRTQTHTHREREREGGEGENTENMKPYSGVSESEVVSPAEGHKDSWSDC